ncbi:hypothetical protein [uncultured Jatrophihabitans sp.]|uniref:hypothetical protein n=1 Tax=uncultured Jatrophihabitans sp. TaxID=1610747 RepID=UPI0035CAA0CF
MPTLTLAQLVAGRDLAAAVVGKLGPIEDQRVVVDARPLISGTTSFASQLVRSILVDARAKELTLVGGPADFAADVRSAADRLELGDQVRTDAALDVAS